MSKIGGERVSDAGRQYDKNLLSVTSASVKETLGQMLKAYIVVVQVHIHKRCEKGAMPFFPGANTFCLHSHLDGGSVWHLKLMVCLFLFFNYVK